MTSRLAPTLRPGRPLRGTTAGLILAGLALSPLASLLPSRAATPQIQVEKTPDSGIQPQAVTDAARTVHLLYFKGDPKGGDLFYRRRAAGKTAWSEPLRVNSQPGVAVATGTIRGGQLALGKGGRVHVVWFGSSEARPRGPLNPAMPADSPYNGTPLLYSRLNDAGTAFEPQRNLMQKSFALDGGPTVAADLQGRVYAVWHAQFGPGKEEARKVWIARSQDEGRTFSPEAPMWEEPTGVCPCCSAKAFADQKGHLYALYRMAANRSERDMVLLTVPAGGRAAAGARIDPWPVDT